MSRRDLIASSNASNRKNRTVIESRTASMSRFWNDASGNFMISGNAAGCSTARFNTLVGALCNSHEMYGRAVVIFTSDKKTTDDIIRLAKNGEIKRKIHVLSPDYKKYDPLFGVDKTGVSRCIKDVAKYEGKSSSVFESFVDAVVDLVADLKKPTCLNVIAQVLHMNAEEISEFAERKSANSGIISRLKRYANGYDDMNTVVSDMVDVFSCISTSSEDSEKNIATALSDHAAIVIEVNNTNRDEMIIRNIVFQAEIASSIRNEATIILSDVTVDETFSHYLYECAKLNSITLGINNQDAMSLFENNANDNNIFQTLVFYRHATDALTEKYLKLFGHFSHKEVINGQQRIKTQRFQLFREQEAHIETRERDTIIPNELKYAVLYGHWGSNAELISGWED